MGGYRGAGGGGGRVCLSFCTKIDILEMKYCVMVLSVGEISYKEDAILVLTHYFKKHEIPCVFIEEAPKGIDVRESHPSWWKLLAHRILPGYDFILCWDLDLLPSRPDTKVIDDFDMDKLCMAWDSCAKHYPQDRFRESFKYNGGLLGIPKGLSWFTERVFDESAPGTFPSYEQYYLNDSIDAMGIAVHVLPEDINVLFAFPEFETARLKHYTYHRRAKDYIEVHREEYFTIVDTPDESLSIYDTRMDMIRALVSDGSVVCEVGIFKGDMAKQLEAVIHPSRLVLIDLFKGVTGSGDQDGNNFEFVDLEQSYEHLKEYFEGKCLTDILRGDSVEMLSTYPDETFDMIYIDADHSYEGCKRDLMMCYKKVKKGGYIMGHDYEMNMKKATKVYSFGVRRAVDTFCEVYSQRICAKGMDGCVSYAIRKT